MKSIILLSFFLLVAAAAYAQTSCQSCAGAVNTTLTVTDGSGSAITPPAGYSQTINWSNGGTGSSITVTSGGTYTATVTWTDISGTGCDPVTDTWTFNVIENSLPVCTAGSNSPICEGGTLTLNGSATAGDGSYNYSWTGPNSFSSTDQNPSLNNATSAAAGTYTLIVTDGNGCESVACTTDVTISSGVVMSLSGSCN